MPGTISLEMEHCLPSKGCLGFTNLYIMSLIPASGGILAGNSTLVVITHHLFAHSIATTIIHHLKVAGRLPKSLVLLTASPPQTYVSLYGLSRAKVSTLRHRQLSQLPPR